MRRSLTLAMAFLLAFLVANAAGEEKKPADEVTTLKLRVLYLERQALALRAELDVLRKTQTLDRALYEAARAADVDPNVWELDLQAGAWVKKGEPKK